jgi:hypothetical protein
MTEEQQKAWDAAMEVNTKKAAAIVATLLKAGVKDHRKTIGDLCSCFKKIGFDPSTAESLAGLLVKGMVLDAIPAVMANAVMHAMTEQKRAGNAAYAELEQRLATLEKALEPQ